MEPLDTVNFSDTALEHAGKPRNYGPLETFDGYAKVTGPCGDTMEFWIFAGNDSLERVSFTTSGCGSSIACGSMTTVLAEGKSIEEAASLEQKDILEALGGMPENFEHCALLAVNTLKASIANLPGGGAGPCGKKPHSQDHARHHKIDNSTGTIPKEE